MPRIESGKTYVFQREDDKHYWQKTVKKGTVQDYAEVDDTVTGRKPAKDGSNVDTFILKQKKQN